MKLKFSTYDQEAIAEYIIELGGLEKPEQEDLDKVLEAINYLENVEALEFFDE